MIAVMLSVTIFLYFWLVGFAVISLLIPNRGTLRNLLVAPTIGFSVLVIPAVMLNFIGIPLQRYGADLVAIFAIASFFVLWRVRPRIPWRLYLPFVLILFVALIINAIPFFRNGFNWVSISNDDATTYVLSAFRLIHQGYWDVSPQSDLLYDASPFGRFFYHYTQFPGGIYHSFDLTLGMVSLVTRLDLYQSYMPLMLSALLMLVSASAALLLRQRLGSAAVLTSALTGALASLNTLGFIHQLGPQVFGLATFAAIVLLAMQRCAYTQRGWRLVGYATAIGIVVAGLNLTYGAYFVLLVPPLLAFAVLGLWRRQIKMKLVALTALLSVSIALLLTNLSVQALQNGVRVTMAFSGGRLYSDKASFPFYVVPSGLANFWGIYPIAANPSEPWLSMGIAIGGILTIAAAGASIWLAFRGMGVALVAATIFGVLGLTALRNGDFALFKLTMYIQPFLWPTVTAASFIAITRLVARLPWSESQKKWAALSPILLLSLFGLNAQHFYIVRSEDARTPGRNQSSFVTMQHATTSHLLDELRSLTNGVHASTVIIDTDSHALSSYESYYNYGRVNLAPSANLQRRISITKFIMNQEVLGRTNFSELAIRHMRAVKSHVRATDFNFDPGQTHPLLDAFTWYQPPRYPKQSRSDTIVFESTSQQTVLNRSEVAATEHEVVARPLSQVRDHLILINGNIGIPEADFYRNAELYGLDDDYFYKGETFSPVGRYLLFSVINPTPRMHAVLDITASLNADGENRLPPASVVGAKRVRWKIGGRGSARVISPALEAQNLLGDPFVGIDMGVNGHQFPNKKTGLMRLYGVHQGGDPRILVGFARNISLISDLEYQKLSRPSKIADFPGDLKNPNLEYSGLYEDGWFSEDAYSVLRNHRKGSLQVKGVVPDFMASHFQQFLIVTVDGHIVAERNLPTGEFKITTSGIPAGIHRVSLRFLHVEPLPNGDGRKVAARAIFLGFP